PGGREAATSCATPGRSQIRSPTFLLLGPACALARPARNRRPYKQVARVWPRQDLPRSSPLHCQAKSLRGCSPRPPRYSAAALIPGGTCRRTRKQILRCRILRYPGLTQIPTDNRCGQDAEKLHLHQLEPAASSLADTGGSTGTSDLNRAARVTRQARTSVLTVGAIIESDDEVRQIAVARAVDQANAFFASRMDRVSLTHDIRQISPGDSFQANREACSLLEKGVVAIVGPTSPAAAEQVRSVCEHHTMPHITADWNYRATERRLHYSVNLNPHHGTLGSALMDFIRSQETWGHFAIIYRDPDTLLKYELMLNKLETPVITRQWVKKSGSYKHILTDLKNAGVFGYFVDIPVEDVLKFMILAKAMNMTSANHSYIFTSWVGGSDGQLHSDLHAAAGAPPAGQYGRGPAVERMRAEIFNIETQRAQYPRLLENMIPMAAAIVFDSIQLLANGIHFTSRAQPVEPQPMTCGTGQRFWQNGASLLNFMRSVYPGGHLTADAYGPVKFDSDWRRVNFSLRAYELTSLAANSMKGTFAFLQIGSWDRLHGFNISRTFQEPLEEVQKKLQNKTLRVTTVEDAPFIKVKNKNDSNNPPQFDGFCIQMLNLIAQEAGFNFTVRLVEDGNYGTKTGNDSEGNEVLERHDRGAHRQ
uniref:Lig_chan-Glu_bd domain-containing protein n=1 Tax=Macrostomum lignano TaxID=282301 RepID=A0A1I8F5M4_9PLAT